MSQQWTAICKTAELLPGEYRSVVVGSFMLALFNVDGQYYALEDVCTHDGGELAGGDFNGFVVECARHGAQFDVRTGAVLSPPACVPVRSFAVKVSDGMISVMSCM